jgi:hypothetical protein
MTYLAHEQDYRRLIEGYLGGVLGPEAFVDAYFRQWRIDRDAQWIAVKAGHVLTPEERVLCGMLDQIFTACDCFCSPPDGTGAIRAEQLLAEVRQLALCRWRGIVA